MPVTESDSPAASEKTRLRTQMRTARARLSEESRSAARRAISAAVTQWCQTHLEAGSVIAGYVPLSSEPLAPELLAELSDAGYAVIVPVTLPDDDLDWRPWNSEESAGIDAVRSAALVLVPAFAVDRQGHRLGRGKGCYDRALTRTNPTAVTAAVLFDDELVDAVPNASWDIPVCAVFSPSGFGVRPIGG